MTSAPIIKNIVHQLDLRTSAGELIGKIAYTADADTFSFEYDESWIKSVNGYPISPAINFSSVASSSTVKKFFENLLPEGKGLDAIAQLNKVSKINLFAILIVVGQESTGGLMIVPPEFPFKCDDGVIPIRLIPDEELLSRIQSRDTIPFSAWDGKIRLSIAGFQDKIAVFISAEKKMYFAEHPLASTHIIKPLPSNPELSTVVANEYYCMNLASLIGLQTANTRIHQLAEPNKTSSVPVLIVERFDRVFNADVQAVDRLHIIDACQLLNMSSVMKYERNYGSGRDVAHIREGVSLRKLFESALIMKNDILFTQQLLRWVLFQYIIGNADAHGKNISFFVKPGGELVLAPTYDVVSTVIYNGLDDHIAMGIGDEFKFKDIGAYHWAMFAEDCFIPRKVLSKEMNLTAKNVIKYIEQSSIDLTGMTDSEIHDIHRIKKFAIGQCEQLIHDAKLVKQVILDDEVKPIVEKNPR